MSVILVTGPTGGGKTALVVDMLAHTDEFKNRPLFVMGIPELKIEHHPVPPVEEWTEQRPSPEDPSLMLPYFTFPPNAVIVIDEAQRVYRPRAAGAKVPDEVAAFETHRHTGVDFILLTQHPNFIDSNVRKLVRRHLHILEHALGRDLLEWPRLGEVETRADRELAARKRYKPPARAFALYKSAEAHTVLKRSIPKYVWLMLLALSVFLVFAGYSYIRISSRGAPAPSKEQELNRGSGRPHGNGNGGGAIVKTAAQYVAEQIPRIPGVAYSAPMYDNVTTPTQAPYPVGCVQFGKRCRCIDQQGNTYATSPEICQAFITDGLFIAWRSQQQPESQRQDARPLPVAGASAPESPGPAPVAAPVPVARAPEPVPIVVARSGPSLPAWGR